MKTQITATWNPARDEETKLTLSKGYGQLTRLEKLDFLNDIIGDLTTEYNKVLSARHFHRRREDKAIFTVPPMHYSDKPADE